MSESKYAFRTKIISVMVVILFFNFICSIVEAAEETAENGGSNNIVWRSFIIGGILGVILFAAMYIGWWIYQANLADERRPYLLILNPIDRITVSVGKFREYHRSIRIPVSDPTDENRSGSGYKTMWGAETDNWMVIPAYGRIEDLVITGRDGRGIKIMMAEIIGTTKTKESAENAIRKWSKYTFPEDVWDIPPQLDVDTIPPNIVFVRPIYKREWGPIFYRRGLSAVQNVFGEVNRLLAVSDREQEVLHSSYSKLLSSRMQAATELIITMFYRVLEIWDNISEDRVLPWEVYGRIVHLPMDKLNFTGLQQAMHGGNLHDTAGKIVGNLRGTLDELADRFGVTTMAEPTAKMLLNKLGDLQHKLGKTMKREQNAESQLRDLVKKVSRSQGSTQQRSQRPSRAPQTQGRQSADAEPSKRPVLKMYKNQ